GPRLLPHLHPPNMRNFSNGKDVRARDIKKGDEDFMTADEYLSYWPIKEKLDETDTPL
ncbi:9001_t:CDS:2, partial [Acaulospora colombiana]